MIVVNAAAQTGSEGSRGAVFPWKLSAETAKATKAAGYAFCIRTLGAEGDPKALDADEAALILAEGLALFAVQNNSPSVVSAEAGAADGAMAVDMAKRAAIKDGVNIFCRLNAPEGTSPQAIIEYQQAWYKAVLAAGYDPGLCVADSVLTGDQLYKKLSVSHYWQSREGLPEVAVRGYQIVSTTPGHVAGVEEELAWYVIRRDKKHDAPVWEAAAAAGGTNASAISTWVSTLPEAATQQREDAVLAAVKAGQIAPISWVELTNTHAGHTITFWVSTDALRIGTASDSVRVSVTAITMQKIADLLDCVMPTTAICDLIWEQAAVKLEPFTCTTTDTHRVSTSLMRECSAKVDERLANRTGLAEPVGKNWVLTNRIEGKFIHGVPAAATYGMYCENGDNKTSGAKLNGRHRMIQDLATCHDARYTDYSQVMRLVKRRCVVDGVERDITEVMQDATLCGLVSNEGPLRITRQPGA